MKRSGEICLFGFVFLLFIPILSFAGVIELPQTGQTTCYDSSGNVINCAGTGQDGDIQAGVDWPDPRFKDNEDGTITDNLTGLMWLKDGNCFGSATWEDALNIIADFNSNSVNYNCQDYTANYSDWVLPNINELKSLINADEPNMATWLNNVGFINVQIEKYWSSTTYIYNTAQKWAVSMDYGFIDSRDKGYDFIKVWAVRAGALGVISIPKTGQNISYTTDDDGDLKRGVDWPSPRFTDNGNGTVTDNLTGLIWLMDANCFGAKTWEDALNTIEDFNNNPTNYNCQSYTEPYSNWNLPNYNELYSLIDFSQYHTNTIRPCFTFRTSFC